MNLRLLLIKLLMTQKESEWFDAGTTVDYSVIDEKACKSFARWQAEELFKEVRSISPNYIEDGFLPITQTRVAELIAYTASNFYLMIVARQKAVCKINSLKPEPER